MTVATDIKRMETDLSASGRTVKALCDAAGINQSTWTRWKAGDNAPNMATWQRVCEAFKTLAAQGAE